VVLRIGWRLAFVFWIQGPHGEPEHRPSQDECLERLPLVLKGKATEQDRAKRGRAQPEAELALPTSRFR
jgi:hypothetical protein